MPKKFRDLAAPIYADPERRARVEAETQAAIAAVRLAQVRRVTHALGVRRRGERGSG